MTTMRPGWNDDRGSIPLAMLAGIIVSGIVVSLGAVMVTQTVSTRTDRDFTQAVQVADAGLQEAVFRANNLGNPAACTQASPCTRAVDEGSYSWYTTPVMQGSAVVGYDVISTGTEKGRTRTLKANLRLIPRFPLAAFGDQGVELKGSNGADSYNSSTGQNGTGNGQIGSNGNVNFNGASTTVDSVVLYNHDAAGNTCNQNGNGSACANVTTIGPKLDLASAVNMKFIDDQIAACKAAATGGALPDWVASQNSGVLNGLNGGVQCFNSVNFDVNTTISNGPAVLFVSKGVTFEKQRYVNCTGCPTTRPVASQLQIFSAGTQDPNNSANDTENIAIGNQSYIGAAIYAPRAACLGNPSAAQADVYGALICGSIGRITSGNQGGWAFHYDDALAQKGTGGFAVTRVDEVK
jgi:hypothetical protein